MKPAVLLSDEPGPYRGLEVDCFDLYAMSPPFTGGQPVIAHPCGRPWGHGRHMRRTPQEERFLGLWALAQVRKWGGVLVHPANSQLWAAAGLPLPGHGWDVLGGWTMPVWQSWFGHPAPKPSWLYIVGYQGDQFPAMPFRLRGAHRPPQGGATVDGHQVPLTMAHWLCGLAGRIGDLEPWRYADFSHAAA